mmetsp:Transcript_3550/g.5924  ORF Transcript_3550/g.5924 Transcript_3550/m.5924 type:complete len:1118 (+) Transcript_3550:112-3465(+)|eukprot:CAMPEP_0171497210 /NCGR_PEP_ID=MMETSP0958-20121227/7138_1 /TAXON_ID=87120 /ORGANISM="Aurantiochytrium limacinum, Strain ATCCMYA-1381" /LENGTH=1117 /DNA_ID=CAMNT_0012031413 /DNA_START=220 /DNA_END=3573 /DNA_ORIENTATION=+
MAPSWRAAVSVALLALASVSQVNADDTCNVTTTAMCSDLSSGLTASLMSSTVSVTTRTDCTICQSSSPSVSTFDACCSQGVTDEDSCREVKLELPSTVSSVVRPTEVSSVSSSATLTIPISMSNNATAEYSCSRTCKLYGDPEGVSFCGVYAEFVLCDGRVDDGSSETCEQSKETCESRVDYYGNQCVYLPDEPDSNWTSFDNDGSPCQMVLQGKNTAPTMTMYSRTPTGGDEPSYSLVVTIGERGIITQVDISYDGVVSSLDAQTCLDTAGSWDAWSNADNIRDFGNATVQDNGKQVIWELEVEKMGLRMICQYMSSTRARWDIETLYVSDTADEAALDSVEDGFCITSVMDMGEATQSDIENFHSLCMAKYSPNLLVCRTISKACTSETYETTVNAFCNSLPDSLKPTNCASTLITQIKKEIAGLPSYNTWSNYFCRIISNYDDTLTRECTKKVEDFGFPEVYAESGYQLNSIVASTECDLDASLEVNTEECFNGVQVVVELDDGTRETIASIPLSRLVCDVDLVLTGADYPEVFLYDVYLEQCGMSDTCNAARGFSPLPALTVGSIVEMDLADSVTSSSASDSEPEACSETSSTDIVSSCPTQCCMLENDGAPICLNVTVSSGPFCDIDNPPDNVDCSSISSSSAYVDINITLTDDAEDATGTWVSTCCETCMTWGDPILVPFDSSDEVKWIECDARKADCSYSSSVCGNQRDHLGNTCVWNSTLNNLIKDHHAAIAFYGSPCQPNWELAEEANWLPNVTMYSSEDFDIRIFLGERSVITGLDIVMPSEGYHRFDPEECFNDDATDAWSTGGGLSSSLSADGFTFVCGDIDMNGLERPCAMTYTSTSAFVQFRCIRAYSEGVYAGARINIQGISEYLPYSALDGFCLTGDLTDARGESTVNENGLKCGLDAVEAGAEVQLGRLCKDIWHPTCTGAEIEFAIENWCKYTAVLDFDDYLTCADKIINGTYKDLETRWINFFCRQFDDSDYKKCKRHYTNFLDVTPTSDLCVDSLDEYDQLGGKDPCMIGTSIINADTGDEILFIPDHIPPCDTLRVPASDSRYTELFTANLEFVKCTVDSAKCPMYSVLPNIFCDPARAYSVQLTFGSGDLCPSSS